MDETLDSGGIGSVTVQGISDEELGLPSPGTVAPISADIGTNVEAPITSEISSQAPQIQAVEQNLAQVQSQLPADVSSQIQSLSESLLQQQTQIQDVVSQAVQQQQSVNAAAQQYQAAAQAVNDASSAYTNDYNAWLNSQSGVKRNGQPYTIGQMLAVAKQFGRSPADAWGQSWNVATQNTQGLINKYNQDLNNINSAKQALTDSQNAYNSSLSAYQTATSQLQTLVSDYNNNYSQYQSAVGTAQSSLAAKGTSATGTAGGKSGGAVGGTGNASVGTAGGKGTSPTGTTGNVTIKTATTNVATPNVATTNVKTDKTTFQPLKQTSPQSVGLTPKGGKANQPSSTSTATSATSGTNPLSSALLGSGLSSRPDVSTSGEPYLLGSEGPKRNVWNQESLRNALGI